MTRLIGILLTLLFSLSGAAMGEHSDFDRWNLAANTALAPAMNHFKFVSHIPTKSLSASRHAAMRRIGIY
jgi:hypothetical protein